MSPVLPSVTWSVNPGAWTRRASREKAASAVRGRRKNSPAVSARIPSAMDTERTVRRERNRFKPPRAVAVARPMERRISAAVRAAMANRRNRASARKKPRSMDSSAAASSSTEAMAAR